MKRFSLDFETRSCADLKALGAHLYALDPTTDAWCAAYAFGDEEPKLWQRGEPCPPEIAAHVKAGGKICAWNAQFERLIWRHVMPRYGWPVPALEQYECVMAQAYAMGLPGMLEKAAPALGLDVVKDSAGYRVMMQLCRPRRMEGDKPVWWDDPVKIKQLGDYCRQDLRTEREVGKRVMALSEYEQEVYRLDQRVNDRGVRIDRALATKALKVVADATDRLDREMHAITAGYVRKTSNVQQLIQWLQANGVDTTSVDKENLARLLDDPSVELSESARKALWIRREAAKTSTAKIESMLERSAGDGRMRGNLQYHGASTGRWAARGAQLQNLPRPSEGNKKLVPQIITSLQRGMSDDGFEMMYGATLTCVSDAIRGMITANDGNDILSADFANIEGRVLAWLAGETRKLDAFKAYDAGTGPDIYKITAGRILGKRPDEISDNERQVMGKVPELALGFGGGVGAFAAMAKTYQVKMDPYFPLLWSLAPIDDKLAAEKAYKARGKRTATALTPKAWVASEIIKIGWRRGHGNITAMWDDVQDAAVAAVANPGTKHAAGRVTYLKAGSFLWCRLPSGRALCYPYPRIQQNVWASRPTPEGDEESTFPVGFVPPGWRVLRGARPSLICKGVNGVTKKWEEYAAYGGFLAENNTQAVARDLMADAMLRVERAGYPVVLTVHDEVVSEAKRDFGSIEEFIGLMKQTPAWAAGCPVSAEGWRDSRYRKG